jgi:ferredoxin
MIAPKMFLLNDIDGTSSAVCDVVPQDQQELVLEAAHSCPEQAIVIELHNNSPVVSSGPGLSSQSTP